MKLDQLIGKFQKVYGPLSIRKGNEIEDKPRISTGSLALDYITGGGIPMGKIVEFQGPKSSGKSLLAMRTVDQQLRKHKRPVLWLDAERTWDERWAKQHIRDYKKVNVIHLPTSEEMVELVKNSLYVEDPPGIIVLDSVAALASQHEHEREATQDQRIGLTASLMAYAMRVWTGKADEVNCPIILINQLRDDIGAYSPWGTKDKAPGGRAIGFYASLMLEVRPGEWIKEKREIIGYKVNVTILKSKIWGASQYSRTSLIFYLPCMKPKVFCENCTRYCPNKYGYFDERTEAIDLGIELGVIHRGGPYYSFGDLKVKGREELMEAMDDKMIAKVRKACLDLLKPGG